ncbi:hypothetical protein EDC65_4104 [Stella humosa]|uniref:Uncharacterized protein n=1 Tax=Stella humosa TaxID=94 RepID=A0A3N1KW54_9PROT|nr:hypothetical protein [Stella humosa]ROP83457.1 hypothetical protein EDC65_4104 [Stella humosa]BBK33271.1 hypothetical protein STHU_39050 [Stella humosa]
MASHPGPEPGLKRNIASLVGGFVIAGGVFVLWMLVTSTAGWSGTGATVTGLAVAAVVGGYIRLADL